MTHQPRGGTVKPVILCVSHVVSFAPYVGAVLVRVGRNAQDTHSIVPINVTRTSRRTNLRSLTLHALIFLPVSEI